MNTGQDYISWRPAGNWRIVISLAALALQTILLVLPAREVSHRGLILGIGAVIALAQLAPSRSQSRLWRTINMAMGMTLVGGLGMALGGLIDSHGSAPRCAFCQTNSLLTWSNGLMLVFCFAGGRVFFRCTNNSGIARVCSDCLCMISMTAGMFLGEFLLMPMFRHSGDNSAATHCVMLLGMFFGNVGSLGPSALLSSGFLPARIRKLSGPTHLHIFTRRKTRVVTANNSF